MGPSPTEKLLQVHLEKGHNFDADHLSRVRSNGRLGIGSDNALGSFGSGDLKRRGNSFGFQSTGNLKNLAGHSGRALSGVYCDRPSPLFLVTHTNGG